jgi:integrase
MRSKWYKGEPTTNERFKSFFGKSLDEYEEFVRATTGLKNSTISGYRDILSRFFLYLVESPKVVIENRVKDITSSDFFAVNRYEQKVKAYLNEKEAQGLATQVILNRIQGFFTNNSKRLSLDLGKLDISNETKSPKYSPSQDEVKRLLSFADNSRDKFIVAVMFQNGVLPVDIAGLKIGEYPTVPWVYYKKKRSKTKKTWHGVSTPDTCRFLNDYLVIRKGVLGESLLLSREGVMSADAIKLMLKVLIERSGLKEENARFVPKCLRDGFEDALVDADVYVKVKEAMMGHGGNIQHVYGSAKKLEERCVEAMKKVYPLICLSGDGRVVGGGLDEKLLKTLVDMLPDLQEMIKKQKTGL